MKLNVNNGVPYLTFSKLDNYKSIKHAFSTKLGGVSKNEFASMNLSFDRGDSKENVIKNYHLLCDAVGLQYESLVASKQDHNTNIRIVTFKDKGIGVFREHDMQSVDGLLTNEKNLTLVTYYADCTPIYFFDPINNVVGLAHAGWRGTVGKIAKNMIIKMKNGFKCDPKNIICAVGPAIGKCCFEVDYAVCEQFEALKDLSPEEFIEKKPNNKYNIDLLEVNKRILLSTGVLESNIQVSDICTKCNSDLLFSHRATNGKRGGMAAFIALG